jgi:hypothetical protein
MEIVQKHVSDLSNVIVIEETESSLVDPYRYGDNV